jgi:quinol monooxygenase YgiN
MMSNPTLRVVARLVALPDKVEELKVILIGLIEPTRAEKGNLKYQLLQNRADPTDFTFVEEWETEADLEAHLKSTHIQTAIGQLDNLVAINPDIQRYNLIL